VAKIKGTIKKITYHVIDLDTDDYIDNDAKINDVFDFFESVKEDPMDFAEEFIERIGNNAEIEVQSIKIED